MSHLTLLNLDKTRITADYESSAPTGVSDLPSMSDVTAWESLLIGLKTQTGQVVTPEKAKRCATVLAIMRGLAEDVSSLPLGLFQRKVVNGVPIDIRAEDHVVNDLLGSAPNDLMTPLELREHLMFDMMLHGGFFVLQNMLPNGKIESLWPLQAGYVTRRWREAVWLYTDPLTGVAGQFSPETVWRGTIMGNGIDGEALTLLAREAIGMLIAAEEQGARLFKQGVQTDLALTTPPDVTLGTDEKDQLRQAFMARHSGSINAFMPLLLEGGITAARIGLTAQESQYLESRAFQMQDIARVFRYPEVLLGSSGKGSKSATYASAEQFFQSYTKHTLTPWAVRIEQTAQRDLLTPNERARGFFIRHDFNSLLRADTAGRYGAYAIGIDKGFITPGYAARQEQLPWKPELEYYNKPQPGGLGQTNDEPKPAPTDQSGKSGLPGRVANYLLLKERKGLAAEGKQDAAAFYERFSAFVEDMTGADLDSVREYCEMRRNAADRFSPESEGKAIDTLTLLCEKDG